MIDEILLGNIAWSSRPSLFKVEEMSGRVCLSTPGPDRSTYGRSQGTPLDIIGHHCNGSTLEIGAASRCALRGRSSGERQSSKNADDESRGGKHGYDGRS